MSSPMAVELAAGQRSTGARSRDYPITLLGPAVEAALAEPGTGQVLAVFRRSFYVEMTGGAIACIGPPGLGAGPLNALAGLPPGLDWQARGLRQGNKVVVGDDSLRLADGTTFRWPAATVWRPAPIPPDWQPHDLARGLAALYAMTRDKLPTQGLGRFIPALARTEPITATPSADLLDVSATAAPAIASLCAWLRHAANGHADEPPARLRALIGLGPGLTPSGDDFLGGAMIALRALGRAAAADRLAATVVPLAEAGTGRISGAHLAWAAQGLGSAVLHDILGAIVAGETDGLDEHITAIDAIGHCSGWDALAGAVAACEVLASAHKG